MSNCLILLLNTLTWVKRDMNRKHLTVCQRWFFSLMAWFAFGGLAYAGPYSAVVVFGDSLSDNGNLYAAAKIPGAPYYNGRRSNGPVAVEDLAAALNAPLKDFAWIGATTGLGGLDGTGNVTSYTYPGIPGMANQFAAASGSLTPYLSHGLFVVWGGPNDWLAPSPLDGGDPAKIIKRAVENEIAIITALQGMGAYRILAPGMPDLGLTPYFTSINQSIFGSSFTKTFNDLLLASLPSGVLYYDTAALTQAAFANPAAYGFTNVTDACFDKVALTLCANPNQYLYFDDFHPSATAHALIAQGFYSAVPEPPAVLLLGLGIMLLLARRGRAG